VNFVVVNNVDIHQMNLGLFRRLKILVDFLFLFFAFVE